MKLLMIAAPSGGKGTQGDRLAAKFGVRHISSGDVLRAEVRAGTPAGLQIAAYLNVPDPVLIQRLLARARADDTAEVIEHRLQVFAEVAGPLIAYYRDRGILVEVNGDQPPEAITEEIQARLP